MEQQPARKYPGLERTPEERDQAIQADLVALKERYGERLPDVLESSLMAREITYDDYIQTPTLLSLQQTYTEYHDELIFKIYHQQTELWFRLVIHEMDMAIRCLLSDPLDFARCVEAVTRTNRYFEVLTYSYSVLLDGLSTEEFLEYRKIFGTSSGFQSSQFRAIEILAGLEKQRSSTEDHAAAIGETDTTEYYWEKAARHITTHEPTLTLLKFKEQHLKTLNDMYQRREPYSLRFAFLKRAEDELGSFKNPEELVAKLESSANADLLNLAIEMAKLDSAIIGWKQEHLRVVAKHLRKAPKGTGETNWAQYLSRSIREQRCFPELEPLRARLEEDKRSETTNIHG